MGGLSLVRGVGSHSCRGLERQWVGIMKSYLPSGLWGPGWNDKKAGQLRLLLVPSTCTLHVLWATPLLWIIWQLKALRTKVLPDIRWPFQLWTVTLPPIWSTLLTEAYTDLFKAQRRPTPHRCFRLKNKVSLCLPQSTLGIPHGSVVKNPPPNAGDVSSILESGRSPGEGNGNPLQYACLGNPMY